MEKGEYRVSLDNLFKILAIFDLDLADFFGDGPAFPSSSSRSASTTCRSCTCCAN